jgi:hypothetical protein
MATVPLRIRFASERVACEVFDSFPPEDLDYVEGWSRKRDGDCQVLLLHLADERFLEPFLALCRRTADVVEVMPIAEAEFWNAPSNPA